MNSQQTFGPSAYRSQRHLFDRLVRERPSEKSDNINHVDAEIQFRAVEKIYINNLYPRGGLGSVLSNPASRAAALSRPAPLVTWVNVIGLSGTPERRAGWWLISIRLARRTRFTEYYFRHVTVIDSIGSLFRQREVHRRLRTLRYR
ncbi:hypothetical protein EVAR_75384_1 [Eumeta japonica]|uniref:Uncharacterized protein n=1 Tax=Eumeta variegata TaxID=151549 RepID=A0A4C1TMV9_EUMVA|nr:hypothetical protein EVAR_75384_1 [Eumeta japonica]